MTISILYEDPENPGYFYDLTDQPISFGDIQLGESKKMKVQLVNNDANRNLTDVVVSALAHPTEQVGTAEDTYDVTDIGTDETGPFSNPLSVGTIGPGAKQDLWIRWSIEPEALPGVCFFATKATGEYAL